ncbi:MAG: response regulator [Candidatus Omnitrophota bacterium]|nr:response regulator [Candidatus Omnitrophota bacterium]
MTDEKVPKEKAAASQAKKILVVDDEEGIRNLIGEALTRNNYDVVTACDGEEALATVTRENPDLIILDVLLPKMTGYQVFEKIRNGDAAIKNIPIIVMSGWCYPLYWAT